MAPTYAGILGLLAMATSLARGMVHAADCQSMLFVAWVSLLAFAALGYGIGRIAERTLEESVRAQIQAELDTTTTVENEADA